MKLNTTKKLLVSTVVAAVTSGPASSVFADSASTILGDSSGTLVSYDGGSGSAPVITAILSAPGTVDGYTYTKYAILAQDSTGSLDIFGTLPSGTTFTPAVGDAINVNGTYSPFDSIPEVASLTSLSLISTGNAISSPSVTTIPTLLGLAQSPTFPLGYGENLVTLDNVSLYTDAAGTIPASGNFPTHANKTLYAEDSSGNIIELYDWASSYSVDGALGGTPIPTGPVDITAFLSTSGGVTQITPFSISAVPEPASFCFIGAGALAFVALARRKGYNR